MIAMRISKKIESWGANLLWVTYRYTICPSEYLCRMSKNIKYVSYVKNYTNLKLDYNFRQNHCQFYVGFVSLDVLYYKNYRT